MSFRKTADRSETLVGALMIPGGNDTLLLAAVPAGSASGALAYTIMTFVILACVALCAGTRETAPTSAVGSHDTVAQKPRQ